MTIVLATLLIIVVLAGIGAGIALTSSLSRLIEQNQRLERQQQEIDKLNEQLERKEEFSAAMTALVTTAGQFDGVQMYGIAPFTTYEELARNAWDARREPEKVAELTAQARAYATTLDGLLAKAEHERATNASGTEAERIIDEEGGGFVATNVANPTPCESEPNLIGCVFSNDPYVVHLEKSKLDHPSMATWGEQLIAYHEFAHVLQNTNTAATESAIEAFGGDREFMADCYSLVKTGRTSLDGRVWETSTRYWDVSYGYGRVCTSDQRDVIASWIDDIGVKVAPVSQ